MGLAKRVIPCLDIRDGRVVKGVNFVNLRDSGEPAEVAARYDKDGADELTFLDITASVDKRDTLLATVREVAREVCIPLTVGGGVRCVADVERLLKSGADKVGINTAAVQNPQILADCAAHFGAQCIVLAVDAKKNDAGGWQVVTHGGRRPSGRDVEEWARAAEQLGAGEILLTSMDTDGVLTGYDIALTKAVAEAVRIPVIASGGAGEPAHLVAALTEGKADAALAASIFHDNTYTIKEVKSQLVAAGVEVRLT